MYSVSIPRVYCDVSNIVVAMFCGTNDPLTTCAHTLFVLLRVGGEQQWWVRSARHVRVVFSQRVRKKKKTNDIVFIFSAESSIAARYIFFFCFAPRTKVRVTVVPTRYSALVQQSALNAVSLNVYQRFFDIIVITRLHLHTNVMISFVSQIRIRNGRYVIAIILLLYDDKSYCYLIIFFFYFVIIKTNRAMIVDSLRP